MNQSTACAPRAVPDFAAGRHSWLPPPVQVPARFANRA